MVEPVGDGAAIHKGFEPSVESTFPLLLVCDGKNEFELGLPDKSAYAPDVATVAKPVTLAAAKV